MSVSIQSARRTSTHETPTRTISSALAMIVRMRRPELVLIFVLMIGAALLTGAVLAYNHAAGNRFRSITPSTLLIAPQGGATPRLSNQLGRLALQPEADRFRRRLGRRFLAPGLESTTLVGTLSIGEQEHQVRIVRTQLDSGESVAIALDGVVFTWNATEGAKSGTSPLTGA